MVLYRQPSYRIVSSERFLILRGCRSRDTFLVLFLAYNVGGDKKYTYIVLQFPVCARRLGVISRSPLSRLAQTSPQPL
jgi:hypothetical protein